MLLLGASGQAEAFVDFPDRIRGCIAQRNLPLRFEATIGGEKHLIIDELGSDNRNDSPSGTRKGNTVHETLF